LYQALVDAGMTFSNSGICPIDFMDPDWVIIQRRIDASLDFYKGWAEYEEGFGNMSGNMWLGLKYIHALTQHGCELHVYLEPFEGDSGFAHYSSFAIGDAESKYRLSISGYSGNAGDSLSPHNDQLFSTYDADNDGKSMENCAETFKGAWWYYTQCFRSNLNGQYGYWSSATNANYGIAWRDHPGDRRSYKLTVMKIRLRKLL